jgi:competence protein ComEC
VLYDCGGGGGNVGRDIIAPYLWHRGVTAIDAVVLSHSDADHTGGLGDILDRFAVGCVVVSPYFGRGPDGAEVLEKVRSAGVQLVEARLGQSFEAAGAVFEVLAPLSDTAFGKALLDNDTSLVLRLTGFGASVLFTGDAESDELAALLDSGAKLDSEVLIVPHHGSRNPFVSELVKRTGAKLAIISGGYDQARIAGELEGTRLRVLTTQNCGAIRLYRDGERLAEETFPER